MLCKCLESDHLKVHTHLYMIMFQCSESLKILTLEAMRVTNYAPVCSDALPRLEKSRPMAPRLLRTEFLTDLYHLIFSIRYNMCHKILAFCFSCYSSTRLSLLKRGSDTLEAWRSSWGSYRAEKKPKHDESRRDRID